MGKCMVSVLFNTQNSHKFFISVIGNNLVIGYMFFTTVKTTKNMYCTVQKELSENLYKIYSILLGIIFSKAINGPICGVSFEISIQNKNEIYEWTYLKNWKFH